MATSAIGPGFLTQTAEFTARHRADFAFAILASVVLDVIVQTNVWLVLGVSRRRGQDLAFAVLPGLDRFLVALILFGGLVFNVGNVAGCALGLQVLGLPPSIGAVLSSVLAIALLSAPRAGAVLDMFARVLGGLMILLTLVVMTAAHPDYAAALHGAVSPSRIDALSIVTLLGGTVGGYITYAGVHRLIDAGIGGDGDVSKLRRGAIQGIVVTGVMRAILFLAVLGVVATGASLDPANPAASAFRLGAGEWGYRFFGLVLWSAAITSVVGCSYTTLSFLHGKRLVDTRRFEALVLFIGASLALYLAVGRPVRLLIAAGGLNGLILPMTLGIVLVASRRSSLMGSYRHPIVLQTLGWIAWGACLVAGGYALRGLAKLWTT